MRFEDDEKIKFVQASYSNESLKLRTAIWIFRTAWITHLLDKVKNTVRKTEDQCFLVVTSYFAAKWSTISCDIRKDQRNSKGGKEFWEPKVFGEITLKGNQLRQSADADIAWAVHWSLRVFLVAWAGPRASDNAKKTETDEKWSLAKESLESIHCSWFWELRVILQTFGTKIVFFGVFFWFVWAIQDKVWAFENIWNPKKGDTHSDTQLACWPKAVSVLAHAWSSCALVCLFEQS